jgi:orotate phosphoribosyltransferase
MGGVWLVEDVVSTGVSLVENYQWEREAHHGGAD